MGMEDKPVVEIIDAILDRTGLNEEISNLQGGGVQDTIEAEDRLSAIVPLRETASECKGGTANAIVDLLDNIVTQARLLTETGDAVTVSTIHGAKGLEWPVVIGASMVDGILPSKGSDMNEERRLFYVLCTRAREHLVLSYYLTGGHPPMEASPSPFISEAQAAGYIHFDHWPAITRTIGTAP